MESNKSLVLLVYEGLWNQGKPKPINIVEYFASDFICHFAREIQDLGSFLLWIAAIKSDLHDGEFTIQDQIAENDKVTTRWQAWNSYKTITGVETFRIANNKIIEGWLNSETRRLQNDI